MIALSSKDTEIGSLSKGKWQFVAISHQLVKRTGKLIVFIGAEEKSLVVEYPSFGKKAVIVEQTFCENFSGAINSLFIYSEAIPITTLAKLATNFPGGISSEKDLKLLSELSPSNKYCGFTPFKVYSKAAMNIYNQTLNAKLKGNCGVKVLNEQRYIDPIQNVLPLLHIVSLMAVPMARKAICEVIELACVYLKNFPKDIQFEKASKALVRELGFQLLSLNPSICSEQFIKTLSDVVVIDVTLRRRILKMLMTTVNFWANLEPALLPLFWETLKANLTYDFREYSKMINTDVVFHILRTIDKKFDEAPCCSKHAFEPVFVKYSMSERYQSIKSLLKFTIISDSERSAENVSYILQIIVQKPSACLFLFLITLLRELTAYNSAYTKAVLSSNDFYQLFCVARDYAVEVKIACLSFVEQLMGQLKNEPLLNWKSFKTAVIHMLEVSPLIKSRFAVKLKILRGRARASSVAIEESESELGTVKRKHKTRARTNSLSLKKEGINKAISDKVDKPEEKTVEPQEELKVKPEVIPVSKRIKEQPIYMEKLIADLELLYSAILRWIVGEKPDQALKKGMDLAQPIDKCTIKYSKVISIMISFVKNADCDIVTKRCFSDFCFLAKSLKGCLSRKKVIEWLKSLEVKLYKELKQESSYDELAQVFELHSNLLIEKMIEKDGLKNIGKILNSWSHTIQCEDSSLDPSKLSSEKLQASFSEQVPWICFKNVLIKLFGTDKDRKLVQLWLLTEVTFKAILLQNLKQGFGVKVTLENTKAGAKDDLVARFNVPDQRLLEAILELTLEYCAYSEKQAIESVIGEQLKLMDAGSQKELEMSGDTYFAICLINIGLRTSLFEDSVKWLARIDRLSKYIVQFVKHANSVANTKAATKEYENLQLILSILLNEHFLARKSKLKTRIANTRNALSSVLVHIASDVGRNKTKDFIAKTFGISESILSSIQKLAESNDEASLAELDEQYSKIYTEKTNVDKALKRVSEDTLMELREKFNKAYSSVAVEEKKVEQSQDTKKPNEIVSDNKSYDIANKVKVAKWHRKHVKLQKRLRQWQGAWRNRELFDDEKGVMQLPLKFSKYVFKNGPRCTMKIRYRKMDYIMTHEYPTSAHKLLQDQSLFDSLAAVCLIKNCVANYLVTASDRQFIEKSDDVAQLLITKSAAFKESIQPLDCELYSCFCVKKGKILLYHSKSRNDCYIKFVYSRQKKRELDSRVMLNFIYKPEMKLVKRWKVSKIKVIYKKHIVENKSALEIDFIQGKSILLNFKVLAERDLFVSRLHELSKNAIIVKCDSSLGKIIEKGPTADWLAWKLSTFDYLLTLNNFSARSFDNASQYPIFPWIFDNIFGEALNLENRSSYRDLGVNLGLVGEGSRDKVIKKQQQMESSSDIQKYHFGSLYSNQGIVFQYLVRTFPFIEAYIRLFCGMDDPNRIFHSIEDLLKVIKYEPNDIRELIPEFFTMPEIFVNKEEFKFGSREDKSIVNDVVLPTWANGDPQKFVSGLRKMLESDYASANMCKWVDLVFGYQQKGIEAEKVLNLFPRICYEAEEMLANAKEEEKSALMTQAYHWGQLPCQLFNTKHPERSPKSIYVLDSKARPISVVKKLPKWKASKNLDYREIIKILVLTETELSFLMIALNGTILEYNIEVKNGSQNTDKDLSSISISNPSIKEYNNHYFDDEISLLDAAIHSNFPIVIVKKCSFPYIAQGGYMNGTIQFTQLNKLTNVVTFKAHKDTVTCLELDENEQLAVSGSTSGEVVLYSIEDKMQWKLQKRIWDHGDSISSICINATMQLFCTSGLDGITNLYSYSGNILRTFICPENSYVKHALLGKSPLPCVVMFGAGNGLISTYGLNGGLISQAKANVKDIPSITIGRDSNFMDNVVYINDKEFGLVWRRLPALEEVVIPLNQKPVVLKLLKNQLIIVVDEAEQLTLYWDSRCIIN